MNAYFFNMSNTEKENILDQHKKPYDGLRTMGWEMKNPQTIYTQDFANDKGGLVLNNKGVVKKSTNVGINETMDEYVDIGLLTHNDPEMTEGKSDMCEQCGTGTMVEGMCNECGYKMEGINDESDLDPSAEFDYVGGADNATDTFEEDYDNLMDESAKNDKLKIMEMFVRMGVI